MNYEQLKKDGYYIRVQKGKYNNTKHIEYSLSKDITETHRKVFCLLNYKSVKLLIDKYNFIKTDAVETVWLNCPESLNLDNSKPMVLTWYNQSNKVVLFKPILINFSIGFFYANNLSNVGGNI